MATKKTEPKKPEAKASAPKKSTKPIIVEPIENMVAFDAKAARKALGFNQSNFWNRVFVTQSGGSRYENERSVPKPVQALLVIAYGTDSEAAGMFEHLRKVKDQS